MDTSDNVKKGEMTGENLEVELTRLHREYTLLDKERCRSEFGFRRLDKCMKVFQIFKQEHVNIINDLNTATTPEKQEKDNQLFEQMQNAIFESDCHSLRIKEQKVYQAEVGDQIKVVAKNVQSLKIQVTNDRQLTEKIQLARTTLACLENRLEVQMKKFNMIVSQNKLLRETIDHLMWDRRNFMTVWNKLIERLTFGKKIMIDLIEQASISYDQREEWCNKLKLLRSTARKDLLSNVDKMRLLKGKINDIEKLGDFLNIKGQKRRMNDLYEIEYEKREQLMQQLEERLEQYQMMLDDIQAFSKEPVVKVLAKKYYIEEAANFTTFNFIIDIIAKLEKYNDELGRLHLDIDEQMALNWARQEGQMAKLQILEENLEDIKLKMIIDSEIIQENEARLSEMMQGISRLLKLCHCNLDPILKLLANDGTIHHYNVVLFVQILEHTIHECLITAGYQDKNSKKVSDKTKVFEECLERPQIYKIDQIVQSSPCSLCVVHEMVADVVEIAQKVWNKEEVKTRLKMRQQLPTAEHTLHNISKCHLPQARQFMQQRYR